MKYLRIIMVCSILLIGLVQSVGAAYLKDVPITLKQPNGKEVKCFATGDEFFHYFHDGKGRLIRRNPNTGFYVYYKEQPGHKLAATSIAAGTRAAGPDLLVSAETINDYRKENLRTLEVAPEQAANPTSTIGVLNNIVIFIRFAEEEEFATPLDYYSGLFNAAGPADISLHNYYDWASYHQLDIDTYFYPIPDGQQVYSYLDVYPRSYYEPYSPFNHNGYTTDAELADREWTLLRNAVNSVSGTVDPLLDVDSDVDGYVDNVTFIINGGTGDWSDLLWPHMWWLGYDAYINGARVGAYNFQLNDFLLDYGGGVLYHEMFHSLGAPDLYEYNDQSDVPVGYWDIMDIGSYADPPASMSAYMKTTYGNWIASIPEITEPGVYSLNPLGSSMGVNECYKIASPNSTSEYFVLEYRAQSGFDAGVPGSGLLVYRIDLAAYGEGNAYGPPDEVYLYRPGGTLGVVGSHLLANFSADVGRTAINDSTDPNSFLSSGLPGGLNISNIGSAGATIQFQINMIRIQPPYEFTWGVGAPVDDVLSAVGGSTPYSWQVVPGGNYESSNLGANLFAATGVGQSANDDDASWTYTLPFTFPFYGNNYSSVYVCTNGFLDFTNSSPDYANSTSAMTARVCIAPFWEDLTTYSPDDIYLDESVPGQTKIRWDASTYSMEQPVNFSVVLFDDGRIRFDYGSGNTGEAPTVGISAGNGSSYIIVPGYNGSPSLANANSVIFEPGGLPDGVTLNSSGVFTGAPSTVGDYSVGIRLTDSSVPMQSAAHIFDFHVVQNNISGTIGLESFTGDISAVQIAVELRKYGGGTTSMEIYPDSDGSYTLKNIMGGTYDIAFKGPNWLRKVVHDVVVSGDITGVDASLVNGDCNNDNMISAADLIIVRKAYGSAVGSPKWDVRADLNGDGMVSAADLIIVRKNYGKIGDP